ncbi:MAG TPA: hypothetical protein VED63_00505, partial [Acidimicrobiales bacterium]|nr:hypothetical protein [Acidimicrobiales bacterium]
MSALTRAVRPPQVATVVGAGFVLWGLAIGLLRLHDNSFLTHVATGRIILTSGVPTSDPYSFTAHGHSWVLESWLAELVYGLVDRMAGGHGLQFLHGALAAVAAGLTWMLTRPAKTLIGRIVAAAAALAVGTGYWSPRPLLLALVLFMVLVLMTETGRGSPWLLVPLMWVWVNVHGSWPLALVYLVVRGAGRLADRRSLDRRSLDRLPRLFAALVLGALLAIANPFGVRLLLYPLVVIGHHQAFSHILEWQSPSFSDPVNAIFLAEVLVAMILLVARRGTVEDALVVSLFAAAAFFASRNVPVAAMVTTPVLARGLAGLGSIDGARRSAAAAAGLGALVLVGVALVAGALQRPAYDLGAYPVAEIGWMQRHGLAPGRVATPDYVGNYLEFRYGAKASAFIDDRVDMYPSSVEDAFGVLLSGSNGWTGVLRRYRITAVLWPTSEPLAGLI